MSKQRVIVEAVLAGTSQREVARLYGISQPRVSQRVAAWWAGGWDALEPTSRRPRTNPNATPPQVVDRVLALRGELIADGCDAGPHTIAAILDDELATPRGVTTIWRILTRAGASPPNHASDPNARTSGSKQICPTNAGNPTSRTSASPTAPTPKCCSSSSTMDQLHD